MEAFLQQIARAYVTYESGKMMDYCFVFPNKRSGLFFANYMRQLSDAASLQPQLTTINELVMDLTEEVEATRLELLFMLYNVYCEVMAERGHDKDIMEFDRFVYWGDVILNDFNDVDRYLVDASQLFRNISDLKDLQSNYLSDEQIDVIRKYWGDVSIHTAGVDDFWRHITKGGDNPVSESFIRLWHIMLDLYERFNERLTQLGLAYNGKAYRKAVTRLKEIAADELPCRRYIFVGFNVLSTSEIRIFEILQQRGVADFYWDYASPAFNNRNNKATRFLYEYVSRFKSIYPVANEPIGHFGDIVIEGIPSNIGQAKRAGDILATLRAEDSKIGDDEEMRTAVVLPDEQLLVPMLHSIPSSFANINVTMGFPLRHTPVAALMSNIVLMQSKARNLHGDRAYYYEHVFSVLSHPLLRSIAPEACQRLVDEINTKHIYNLGSKYAMEEWPELAPVFAPVYNPRNPEQVFDYASQLSLWLLENMTRLGAGEVEMGFVKRYHEGVARLRHLSALYAVEMSDKTFFQLLDRTLSGESVNFVGEPLKGLQVMGVLETRALDFDTIIMPSMNERVFPSRHYAPTFIPNNLRLAYGMATIEFQESIFAYYFYRLIARAKRVYLLYDTRTSGIKSGEMSRYLNQLLYLYPQENVKRIVRSYKAMAVEPRNISVRKSEDDIKALGVYLDPNSGRYLSPSAIDKYVKCPLAFYLEYVKNYRVDSEMTDYMDEGTFGNVLHEVAQHLYQSQVPIGAEDVEITEQTLDDMIKNSRAIEREVTRAINQHYLKRGEDCYDQLIGEDMILGEMMVKIVKTMFTRERELAPFTFVAAEQSYPCRLKLADGMEVNLKGKIDRVDRLQDGTIRVTDYKTGSDKISIDNMDQMFETGNENHQKCFLQIFLYANAYALHQKYHGPIQPLVYQMGKMGNTPISPLEIGRVPVNDIRDFNSEFINGLTVRMKELFDPDVPFCSTPDRHACRYCKFTTICDRES